MGTEQRDLLWRVLNELGEEDRLAIGYRYFFDLSREEIGEALGWPQATVAARLARALGRYRQHLAGQARRRCGGPAAARLARIVAAWNEAQLEQALADLGQHLPSVPMRDLSGALVQRLQHGGSMSPSHGVATFLSPRWVLGVALFLVLATLAAIAIHAVVRPGPAAAQSLDVIVTLDTASVARAQQWLRSAPDRVERVSAC